jgi:hypothetical protein
MSLIHESVLNYATKQREINNKIMASEYGAATLELDDYD